MFSLFKSKRVDNVSKTLESSEYTSLMTRITKIEAEILALATAQDVIRNKVLRKIQKPRQTEEEETEDLNSNSVFF